MISPCSKFARQITTAYSPDGGSHNEGLISGTVVSCPSGTPVTLETIDATGVEYAGPNTGNNNGRLITRDGISHLPFNPGVGTTTLREDPNGNQISETVTLTNTNPYQWSYYYRDTLARTIPLPPPNNGTQNTATTDYTGCTGPLPISSAVLWSPPGPNGGTSTFKFCYAMVSLQTNFQVPCAQETNGGAPFLQSVVLPNGTAWTFEYNSRSAGDPSNINYGDLTKITFPTGGSISYSYANASFLYYTGTFQCASWETPVSRTVVSRTVDANDGTGSLTWSYRWGAINYAATPATMTNVMTDPLGNDTVYLNSDIDTLRSTWRETNRQLYRGSQTSGALLRTVSTDWAPYNPSTSCQPNPALPIHTTTIWPNGKTTKMERDYDFAITWAAGCTGSYGDVIAQRDYDYGNGAPGALLRSTATSYLALSNSSYLNNNLLDLVSSLQVNDGSGVQQAYTTFGYDESQLASSGITTQHDSNPPTGTTRGNLTSVNRWLNKTISGTTITATNTYIPSQGAYFDTGTVYQSTDPMGHTTTYAYSPSFAAAYVTQTQFPDTNSPNLAHHIVSRNYDFNTGLLTSFTDQNGNTSTYSYDNMFRITAVAFPDGGATNFYYPDPNTVERQQKLDGSRHTDVFVRVDGVGRVMRRITANGESTPWDQVDTCYGPRGQVSFVSYPYQGTGLSMAQVCSGAGDSFTYDALGRTAAVTHSDGTNVQSTYVGAATLVSDEGNGTRSVQRVSQVDGLSRLISVCEVTSTTQLGITGTPAACGQDVAATGFLTTYSYDPLGNLLSVSQGGLNPRTFTYDSLSRLLVSTNPESGNIWYNYNNDGLVIARIHPAPNQTNPSVTVSITASYDLLHRLLSLSYSDATPGVSYNYDESSARGVSLTNTIGRKSSESTAGTSPTGGIFSYDTMARVLNNSQCTPQNCGTGVFPVSYGYDLVGNITSATNGLGTTLTYSYNVAPGLTTISSSLADSNHPGTLLSGTHYNAFAAHTAASLGNGLSESLAYFPRGWLQLVSVGTSGGTYNLSLTYAGDGDILTANDSVNGNWNYGYDDFNRLCASNKGGQQSLTCTSTNNTGQQAFEYVYDRFGNRWQQNVTAGSGPASSLGFDANNHITSGSSVSYDAAGNVANDGVHSYTYDAENRITGVDGGATASYLYDADGRRVRKTTSGSVVDYIYDLAGHIITEISSTGTWNRGEVYAGGRHVATYKNGTTYFIHPDWLATERARTGVSGGGPVETCTSLPFGDSMNCAGTDLSPLHFTGKERDVETADDYFGARYYNSLQARWLTPDWSARPQAVPYADSSPQSLNLYAYVLNNPTTHLDPDGHKGDRCDASPCDDAWQFDSANDRWLVGGRIWSPNGGTPPVTVQENVINDTEANNGQGLTDKQKAQFAAMQKETQDLYAQVNIHFSVTHTQGYIVSSMGGLPVDITGAQSGALNVFVTGGRLGLGLDPSGTGAGSSGIQTLQGTRFAFTFIGLAAASHWTLSHELAHHFLGDTQHERGYFGNLFRESYINRLVLPHIQWFANTLRQNASSPCFAGDSCP